MTSPEKQIDDDAQLLAPPKLVADLKRVSEGAPSVPPELDAEISSLARAHFAAAHRRRRTLRWLSASAAAAVLVAVLWVTLSARRSPFDVNGDGRVDILDAYAIAAKLNEGKAASARFDVNHDGVVDYRDVNAVAMEAVRLDRRQTQ